MLTELVSCQYCVLVNNITSWVCFRSSDCFHPLSTEMEPGFGIWEGRGRLFVEAVAERQRHRFCSFARLLQEQAPLPGGASGLQQLARGENVSRPQRTNALGASLGHWQPGCC